MKFEKKFFEKFPFKTVKNRRKHDGNDNVYREGLRV